MINEDIMDFWSAVMLFFLIFLIMSCCGYCCTTKRRGVVLSTPVVVTSATHAAPAGGYQVAMPPQNGYQTNVYAAPYPTHANTFVQMPMPMPAAQQQQQQQQQQQPQPGIVGYPPMPMPQQYMNPPSYDAAVASPAAGQTNNVPYAKQSPYNPNYTAN